MRVTAPPWAGCGVWEEKCSLFTASAKNCPSSRVGWVWIDSPQRFLVGGGWALPSGVRRG